VVAWFNEHQIELRSDGSNAEYAKALTKVTGLFGLLKLNDDPVSVEDRDTWAEFILHGLAEHSRT
jgi:hypothetical protein